MSALRGKKLDSTGKKLGVSTGKTSNCGKQSDRWASDKAKPVAPTAKKK